jgi:hypothetical protein
MVRIKTADSGMVNSRAVSIDAVSKKVARTNRAAMSINEAPRSSRLFHLSYSACFARMWWLWERRASDSLPVS